MAVVDKKGHEFEVKTYRPEDLPFLVEMYHVFSPKARFQGMPPKDDEVSRTWVTGLTQKGDNFLAWREGRVIGHVVILPDFSKEDAEYLIFVSKESRGLGVGHMLTHTAIERARDLNLKIVWLTVDAYNFKGIKLYKKHDFKMCEDASSHTERVMILTL